MELDFSVDLQAELRKITQTQYLNHVHYLIQILRHALTHSPSSIQIHTRDNRLILTQDGMPFNPEEWYRLKRLTSDAPDKEKQEILALLEKEHGVTFLSLLVNSPLVYIAGPTGTLCGRQGQVQWGAKSPDHHQGYHLELEPPEAVGAETFDELVFYAGGVDKSVTFNGRPINRPIELKGQMLVTRFKNEEGHGAVGLPVEGDFCHITFYKQGVRVGMKQFVPEDGRVFHAFWNADVVQFEDDFRETISSGDKYINQFTTQLYEALPRFFPDLEPEWKERVKKLVLALDAGLWAQDYETMPLFHSARQDFAISWEDLEVLDLRFYGIPFLSAPSKEAPDYLPRLGPEDMHFVTRTLEKEVKLAERRMWRQRPLPTEKVDDVPPEALSQELLQPEQVQFLQHLNVDEPYCRFAFSQDGFAVKTERNGYQLVLLPAIHPAVLRAMSAVRSDPETVSPVRYRLLALATKGVTGEG